MVEAPKHINPNRVVVFSVAEEAVYDRQKVNQNNY
jgi:hypothetical protein